MNNITLFEAARLLLNYDDYYVVIHAHPDGDAMGSGTALCLGLKSLGKKVHLLCADPLPATLRPLAVLPFLDPAALPEDARFITVDVADRHLCGKLWEKMDGKVLLKLDHHRVSIDFAQYNYTDPDASAAGEVIYHLLELLEISSLEISEALYLAIASDTGGFRYSNTTCRTMEIIAQLYKNRIDAEKINRQIFECKPMSTVRATAQGINSARFSQNGQVAIVCFTKEMMATNGFRREDLAELPSALREIDGVELVVLLKPGDEERKFDISARSKQFFDCAAFCEYFGGGGHLRAGGGAVYADNPEIAIVTIEKEIDNLWN